MRKLAQLLIVIGGLLLLVNCGGGGGGTVTRGIGTVNPPPTFSNASLSGTLVMQSSGANMGGANAMAAIFTADGNGNIANGTIISNTSGNVKTVNEVPFSGTYQVGPDGRGTATFVPNGLAQMNFRLVLNKNGASIIQYNTDAVSVGAIYKQTATTTSSLNGRFIFSLNGSQFASGAVFEQHSAGDITFNGGEVSAVSELVNFDLINTVTERSLDEIGPLAFDSKGIGTATLNIAGAASKVLRVLPVSPDKVVLISNVPGSLLLGEAERQTTAGNTGVNSALSGNYILLHQGKDAQPLEWFNWAALARLTADGNGNMTGKRDSVGQVSNDVNAPMTLTYSMIADGHGTITVPSGPTLHIYLISPDKGVMIGSGTGTFAWGAFQKQASITINAATLKDSYSIAAGSGPTYLCGTWTGDGTSTVSGTADVYYSGTLMSGQSVTGTYQVDTTGRGSTSVSVNAPTVGQLGMTAPFYAVSADEVWAITDDIGASGSALPASVMKVQKMK